MNNELKEAERVAFEAWARPVGFYLTRNEILGHYTNIDTTRAWEGWQARAALAQQDALTVPPGYKLVPVKVTEEMEKAWWTNFGDVHALWAAMLNAAPTLPTQSDDERLLRLLLAVRVAGASLYADDGEMSDCSEQPHIDFKRDSVKEIERKLIERGMKKAWGSIAEFVAPTPPAAKDSGGKPHVIVLTTAEIQSGLDRVRWAELLIRQLPENHDGRNSWLLNYGTDKAERQAEWSRRTGRPLPDHQVQHLPSDDTEGGAI